MIIVKTENANEELSILVYDAIGKLVYTKNLKGSTQINLAHLPKGIYSVNLNSEKQSVTYKLILID